MPTNELATQMVSDSSNIVPYKNILIFSGWILMTIAVAVLLGWFYDIDFFKRIYSHYPAMKFNTTLCMGFLSVAFLMILVSKSPKSRLTSYIIIIPVILISIISFSENIFQINLGIDELFIKEQITKDDIDDVPGRMSIVSCICFLLASGWIILTQSKNKTFVTIGQYLLHIITLFSGAVLFGYLYGEEYLRNFGFGTHMALHASVSLLAFSIVASLLHPNAGITAVFTGSKTGNVMARKMLIRMLVAITVIGYAEIFIHNHNIALPGLTSSILTVLLIIAAILFIKDVSENLNSLEDKKDFAYKNLSLGIEAAPYALIITDNNGHIQHVNNETENLYGYNRNELIGQRIEKLQPENTDFFSDEKIKSFLEKGKITKLGNESNYFVKQKNGELLPVELTLTPFRSVYGPSILISVIDLTDNKIREEIISQQLQELQHKNNELEQFNYIASHDLQEPLRTVANYINLLEEDYADELSGEIKTYLGSMNGAVKRMSTLIHSLLDFGKLGRDKKLSMVNFENVLSAVKEDLNNLIHSSSARLVIDNQLPILYGYETEIRLLLQNLINNAIKFRKNNISPEIHIGCQKNGNTYEFYVADNGIGIERRHFNSIFHIFQRLHHHDVYEGHGIGLANCKKIVEMHGGSIWVESVHGKGSTFWFRIVHLKKEKKAMLEIV